jgi:hypothetical protein
MSYSDSLENLTTDDMVIAEANSFGDLDVAEMVSGHKFADTISAALYMLCGNGFEDDFIGNEFAGGWVTRIGRYVLLEDSQGFVNTRTYDSPMLASWAMDDIRRDMNG